MGGWVVSYEMYESMPDSLGFDLRAALVENGVELSSPPSEILLELTGENDGPAWHWIVKLYSGGFAYIEGSCDYTGWDCRSSCYAHEASSAEAARAVAAEDIQRLFDEMIAAGITQRSTP